MEASEQGRVVGAMRADSHSTRAAIVSVPDTVHADVAVPLLESGIPCLVVKPFAPTLAEARRMCKAAERGRTYGVVDFHKRWDAANVRLRDEIRNNNSVK